MIYTADSAQCTINIEFTLNGRGKASVTLYSKAGEELSHSEKQYGGDYRALLYTPLTFNLMLCISNICYATTVNYLAKWYQLISYLRKLKEKFHGEFHRC